MDQIRLNVPFRTKKVSRVRAWRMISAVVMFAMVGQTTMLLHALPGQNVSAAMTTELDGGGSSTPTPTTDTFKLDLQQWADQTPANWQHGDLNQSNSNYSEGESVPFRLDLTDLTTGSDYVIRIRYDVVKSNKNAYDYLTTYNLSRTPAPLPAGAPTLKAIPTDATLGFTPTAGQFTLWGGSFVGSIAGPTKQVNEKMYEMTLHASAQSMTLLWSGHLASATDWGTGLGASSISGAPFHMAISRMKGTQETSSQDRSIHLVKACEPEPANIKVIKHVVGGTATASNFTMNIGQAASFAGSETGTTKTVTPGTYTISENGGPIGYTASFSGDCDATGKITAVSGKTKTCTVTNTKIEVKKCQLTITKSVDKTSALPGDILTYSIDYKNTGTANCSGGGVRIDDVVPTGTTYTGQHTETAANDTNGDGIRFGYQYTEFGQPANDNIKAGAAKMSWNANIVVPGESGKVTFKVKVNDVPQCSTKTISNVATIASDQTYPPAISSNSVATTVVTSCPGTLKVIKNVVGDTRPSSDWMISVKTGGQDVANSPQAGSTTGTVYTLNPGTYQVGETGPTGFTLTYSNSCAGGNATVVAGQETICTLTNTKNIDHTYQIALDKQGPATVTAGGNMTYSLNWSVNGNTAVTNAIITDALPANTTFVSADNGGTFANGTVTWNLGTKNAGDHGTVQVVVKVASPLANDTQITNTACFDTTETDKVCDDTTTKVSSHPVLSITKTNDVATFTNPGKIVTYTVVVKNDASATETAYAVTLTDVLPAGFTFVADGMNIKSFALGDIAPGASVTTTYTVKISDTQAAGLNTNTATAKGSNTDPANATSTVEVRVPEVKGVEAKPELTITKTANPTVTQPNTMVKYTLTIKNTSDVTATNVIIIDKLPKGFVYADSALTSMKWMIPTLAAGRVVTIPYIVHVNANVKAGKYTNTVTMTADDVSKKQAQATVEVRVPRVAGLATTGVGPRDYAVFAFGLALLGYGLYEFRKQRRALA